MQSTSMSFLPSKFDTVEGVSENIESCHINARKDYNTISSPKQFSVIGDIFS